MGPISLYPVPDPLRVHSLVPDYPQECLLMAAFGVVRAHENSGGLIVHAQQTHQLESGEGGCNVLTDRCLTCLHAASGDAGGGGGNGSGDAWRKILHSLVAFGKFVGGTSKIYGNIY